MDPDCILVGEMRDLETISAAVTAAETGHLVFATLHTTGSTKTVNRLVDVFPTDQQEQIRAQLAASLVTIISQVLMPKKSGGVVAGFEILVVNAGVQHMIRENQTHKLVSAIQTGSNQGMVLLDDHIFQHWKAGTVDYEEALQRTENPQEFADKVRAAGGF
jgi:twitching motility protein PilT